jgi:hypothetical protein
VAFDFSLPERVRRWRDDIRNFVAHVVIPREQDAFRDGVSHALRAELQACARQAGLWAPRAPRELGGGGFRFDEAAVLLEAAGRSPLGPLALNCAALDEGNIRLLDVAATPRQRERYLRPLADGSVRSCFAMTEPPPGAGSDPAALRTQATRRGNYWVLNGVNHHGPRPGGPRGGRTRLGTRDAGRPVFDLATLLTYWHDTGDDERGQIAVAAGLTSPLGFPDASQLAQRYATASGRDLSTLRYALALAAMKLAAILEGVHSRHLTGKAVGGGYAEAEAVVPVLAARGLRLLATGGRSL